MTRSVTPAREFGSKGGMGVFGYLILAGMVVLLVPLLPFLVVLKLIDVFSSDDEP